MKRLDLFDSDFPRGGVGAGAVPVTSATAKADADIVHLLQRTSFGYTEAELALATSMGRDAYLEYQLEPASIDDGGLDTALASVLPALGMGYRQLQRADRDDEQLAPAVQLVVATVARQLFSPRQLYEVMVEFWTNHFNVFLFDGPVRLLKVVDDREHIRPHALGRFADLLHANAASPAMLYYLDNYSNTLAGPNENYARELLELHTLGVDGGYTEHDVKEVARCFTGWTINRRSPRLFSFLARNHDDGEKSVLGEVIPAGGGIDDGRRVLDLLAAHPSTARFLATKLCRRFIADDPPATAVEAVAATYRQTDGDIRSMLRTLFATESFAQAQSQKLKRPAELVASVIRRLDARTQDDFLRVIYTQLQSLGQVPFLCEPPTGYDDIEGAWLSTGGLLQRWNFGSAVAHGEVPADLGPTARNDRPIPMQRFIAVDIIGLLNGARTPEAIVDALIERVLHQPLQVSQRDALLDLVQGSPGLPLSTPAAGAAGRTVLAALLASPQFQRR